MRPLELFVIITIIVFLCLATESPGQQKTHEVGEWNFRISPYFWFVGFKGTIYRPPQPPPPAQLPEPEPRPPYNIDISFKDISSNIKFAFKGAGEFRLKRFVTQFNIASIILQGEAIYSGRPGISGYSLSVWLCLR